MFLQSEMVQKFVLDLFDKYESKTEPNVLSKLKRDFRRYTISEEIALEWAAECLGLRIVIVGKSNEPLQAIFAGIEPLFLCNVPSKDAAGVCASHFSYCWMNADSELDAARAEARPSFQSLFHLFGVAKPSGNCQKRTVGVLKSFHVFV